MNQNRPHHRIRCSAGLFLAFSMAAACSIGGCRKEEAAWKTLVFGDANESVTVSIYSPLYGPNAKSTDTVTIYWDGKVAFSGKLPADDGIGDDGMAIYLVEIRSGLGTHTLTVEHESRSQTKALELKAGQRIHFDLFGYEDDKRVLLQDLGPDPKFR